ncbi:uncharacterized protein PV09_08590 [Verruconis gallopava]|uniref:Protein YIP n=1 Tax=Verruconis gallopava TaxID=253628 RepID=A0A0D2A0D5_9PEZI|nr:uncharacterized protein PV09_08590 [Verruconis gallopava]KIV99784.1 hypothetical protein PV09_08590 [Verruconis gallopava]
MAYAYPGGAQGSQPYGQQGFYNSNFSGPVSGSTTPFQAYGGSHSQPSGFAGFANQHDLSGTMGTAANGLSTGWLAAFGTEGYPGEPPLLEELGVDFSHVKMKTLAVLNPLARIDSHLMDDSDLAGPLLFFLLFGFFLLGSGKIHFGYIYGLALVGSIALNAIFSLMAPPLSPDDSSSSATADHPQTGSRHFSSTLTLARSASILGYCLLPLVVVSLCGIVLPLDSAFGYVLTLAAISYSSYAASSMFCAVGRMSEVKLLVAYPLVLFYSGFGIMAIFSSRGSGALMAKTTGG